MDPVAALDRIVYLLDRTLADAYRVRAYAGAAQTVRDTDPVELERLHRAGRLTELAGVGPKTAKVIADALNDTIADYLTKLESETQLAVDGGKALRAALRGDLHAHSTWSDGGASIEAMARAAHALGHEYIALTDHSPRLTVAHGLSRERLLAQLDEIAALNEQLGKELDGFRILTGIEVDILEDGTLDQEEDLLARLDVVVASVHSKFRMPRDAMTRRMVMAIANPHVDIVGHCTGRKVPGAQRQVGQSDFTGRVGIDFDPEIVFAACQRFDTALEINCRPERQDPPDELLQLALDWNLRLSIDTDAHAPGQLEWQVFGCEKAERHGVDAESVVNTLGVADLLAWTASHPA